MVKYSHEAEASWFKRVDSHMPVPKVQHEELGIRRCVTGDLLSPEYLLTNEMYFSATERFCELVRAAEAEPPLPIGSFLFFGHIILSERFKGQTIVPAISADWILMSLSHLAELMKPELRGRVRDLPRLNETIVCPTLYGMVTIKYSRGRWELDGTPEETVLLPPDTHIVYLKP